MKVLLVDNHPLVLAALWLGPLNICNLALNYCE